MEEVVGRMGGCCLGGGGGRLGIEGLSSGILCGRRELCSVSQ